MSDRGPHRPQIDLAGIEEIRRKLDTLREQLERLPKTIADIARQERERRPPPTLH